MEIDISKSIETLAAKMGIASERLIEYFAPLAQAQWVDVWLAAGVWVILIAVGAWITKHFWEESDGFAVIPVVVILLLVLGGICIEFSEAYKATSAPEAWAIEQILDKLSSCD